MELAVVGMSESGGARSKFHAADWVNANREKVGEVVFLVKNFADEITGFEIVGVRYLVKNLFTFFLTVNDFLVTEDLEMLAKIGLR
jgi:hypothetical protein